MKVFFYWMNEDELLTTIFILLDTVSTHFEPELLMRT